MADKEGLEGDRLRQVMVRDRGTMRSELHRSDFDLNAELAEAARHAGGGEQDPGERATRTANEVFVDRDQMAALNNNLENQIEAEQEQAQAAPGSYRSPGG